MNCQRTQLRKIENPRAFTFTLYLVELLLNSLNFPCTQRKYGISVALFERRSKDQTSVVELLTL